MYSTCLLHKQDFKKQQNSNMKKIKWTLSITLSLEFPY